MQQFLGLFFKRVVRQVKRLSSPQGRQELLQQIRTFFSFIRNYIRIHQALIGLTIFILINNSLVVRAANEIPTLPTDTIISDPYEIADTVRLLEDFTPAIEEDPEAIALNLEQRTTGNFISTNPLIGTEPGQPDEQATPQATPTPAVANNGSRTKDIKYTVEIGDTLSGIGSKFDLKIATIKVKNNLSDVDSLKPGQELIIPAQDLSEKALKAADERKKASAVLAQGQTSKKVLSGTRAGGYGLIVPIHHNGISRRLVGGHTGIDYRANVGTPVMAAANGVVVVADESGWNGGYGRTILLSIGNGGTLRYGHLSDVQVAVGERVTQGEVIGLSGNTGRSTGPHLHFELRVNGSAVDPGT